MSESSSKTVINVAIILVLVLLEAYLLASGQTGWGS